MVNDTNEKISKLWFYLHSLNAALDNIRESNSALNSKIDEKEDNKLSAHMLIKIQPLIDTAEALLKQLENEIKGLER